MIASIQTVAPDADVETVAVTSDSQIDSFQLQTDAAVDLIEVPGSEEIIAFQLVTPDAEGIDLVGPTGPPGPPGVGGGSAGVGGFTFGLKRTAGVTIGKIAGYWTSTYSGTISAWNLTVDAGTITVKIWKIATGTAHPTSADSINTSGISLATGTSVHSTDVSDFITSAVAVGDIFACEITAATGVFDFGGSIEITRT